jgi:hypothetical protein
MRPKRSPARTSTPPWYSTRSGAAGEQRRQRRVQRARYAVVVDPVGQRPRRGRCAPCERVVALAVDRVGGDPVVAGAQRGRAVALVDVEVDDQHARDLAVGEQRGAATTRSLYTQKPSPRSAKAWWVPPARCTPSPRRAPARAAATVPPTDARERRTSAGDCGKPSRRSARASSRAGATAEVGGGRGRARGRRRRRRGRHRPPARGASRSASARTSPSGSGGRAAARRGDARGEKACGTARAQTWSSGDAAGPRGCSRRRTNAVRGRLGDAGGASSRPSGRPTGRRRRRRRGPARRARRRRRRRAAPRLDDAAGQAQACQTPAAASTASSPAATPTTTWPPRGARRAPDRSGPRRARSARTAADGVADLDLEQRAPLGARERESVGRVGAPTGDEPFDRIFEHRRESTVAGAGPAAGW